MLFLFSFTNFRNKFSEPNDNNGFATNAKTELSKKPLTDVRLDKAIEQVNAGTITIDSITDAYDLTPEQLIKIGREVKE